MKINSLNQTSNKELADTFADFFVDKVTKIKSGFQNNENFNIPTRTCTYLSYFQTITQEELTKTIKTMKSTTCPNDPCNTKFILNFSKILVPVGTNIIMKSIEEGTVLKLLERSNSTSSTKKPQPWYYSH